MRANETDRLSKGKVLLRYLNKANDLLKIFEEFFLASAIFIMAFLQIANVVARNVFTPIYFTEEVIMMLIIMVTYIGLGYGARRARHVRMSALFDLSPLKMQKFLAYFSLALGVAVMVFLGFAGAEYVQRLQAMKQLTPIFSIPYWTFVIIAPVGFFMAALRYVVAFIRNIVSADVWIGSDTKNEYDEASIEDQAGI
jgi:TRAP-type C4-dicarboxylate transport system permease small subunit